MYKILSRQIRKITFDFAPFDDGITTLTCQYYIIVKNLDIFFNGSYDTILVSKDTFLIRNGKDLGKNNIENTGYRPLKIYRDKYQKPYIKRTYGRFYLEDAVELESED